MANRTVSNRSVEDFAVLLVEQTCFLRCNPSSLYQALVFGADHSEEHVRELRMAKRDCVKGCMLMSGKPMQAGVASAAILRLDDEMHHSEVLEKEEKRRLIEQQHSLCDRMKNACKDECVRHCSEAYGKEGAKRETQCSVNCTEGCRNFMKSLMYN